MGELEILKRFNPYFRRTEEIILAILDKPTKNLFDLNNPMFFEKNVLCENYSNLRRHLSLRSGSNESHGSNNKTENKDSEEIDILFHYRFLLPFKF